MNVESSRAYGGPWNAIRQSLGSDSRVNYTWFTSHLVDGPWNRGRVVVIGLQGGRKGELDLGKLMAQPFIEDIGSEDPVGHDRHRYPTGVPGVDVNRDARPRRKDRHRSCDELEALALVWL